MTRLHQAVHRFLEASVVGRDDIERFLDPDEPKWARFDPDLGYVPNSSQVQDGRDGAVSTYRYGTAGERLMINYADRACRLNSYGDSFTQCHQVSDGETWQEYLAAHLGEPIRNFGVGGYGVYQAYLRLQRAEAGDAGAERVLFNIYLDDHYRNLDAYRLLRVGTGWWDRSLPTGMFHANPWRHVRFDASARLVERPNPCPTEESLYNLCDSDFLIDTFGDDLVVQLLVARQVGEYEFLDDHLDLARAMGVPFDTSSEAARSRSAERFYDRCAFQSTLILLAQLQEELASQDKKLLVLLSYPAETVIDACHGRTRPDREFVDQLPGLGISFIDSLASHVDDYAAFSISPEEYADRYYYGHYTPEGNHFFAFAIRPQLLQWLDPAPPTFGGTTSALDAGRLA